MGQYKDVEVGSVVYFWFAANATTGTAGDGATPLYDVRLAGAAAGAAPTASGTPTLLTHANYTDGLHEIAIDTTGYAAGEYAVFCTLTISTVNPAGFCGSFKVVAVGDSLHSAAARIMDAVPNATAGEAGGLFIAGSNAATTFASLTCTGALTVSDGIVVTCSTSAKSALKLTGGATSGVGMEIIGTGTGNAITATGAAAISGAVTAASLTLSGALQAATIVSTGTTTFNALTVTAAMTVGTNAIPWNSAWDTEVESEANDALVALNLDHLVGTATGIPALPAGTWLDILRSDGSATYDRTTDSLQAIRDKLPANLEDLNITDTTGLVRPDMANASGNYAGTVATVTTVTGGATATEVAKIVSALVLDGAVYQFTANALELAPTGGLDAAGVRTAIGLASANLDTQLADIPTVAEMNARTLASASYATPTNITSASGVVLASTGLDSVSAAEVTAKPTTFRGWLMWLVQRYRHAAKDLDSIEVMTTADAVATTQTITDDGAGTETIGEPS